MFPGRRLTLLLIPEEGGRTFEFKIPRLIVWLSALAVAGTVGLLAVGGSSFLDARYLARQVERLQREKEHLRKAVSQIDELELSLAQLQRQSEQLRRILASPIDYDSPAAGAVAGQPPERYISSLFRLQSGQIRTVPALWPARGVVVKLHSAEAPGVIIAMPPGNLVRATAAGRVVETGFDDELGNVMRVDHGNGLATLYGHNRSLLAETGEYVYRGQPLALSGASGRPGRPALYFALFENELPRDPARYRLWL